jgi:hypothetical protein
MRVLCVLVAAVILMPVAGFAKEKEKDQGKLRLSDPVRIGSAHLKPGSYKVEWAGSGQNVNVNFLQHNKIMAKAEAKVIQLQRPSPYDAAVLRRNGAGKSKALDEIDFDNRTEALRIEPASPGAHTSQNP